MHQWLTLFPRISDCSTMCFSTNLPGYKLIILPRILNFVLNVVQSLRIIWFPWNWFLIENQPLRYLKIQGTLFTNYWGWMLGKHLSLLLCGLNISLYSTSAWDVRLHFLYISISFQRRDLFYSFVDKVLLFLIYPSPSVVMFVLITCLCINMRITESKKNSTTECTTN